MRNIAESVTLRHRRKMLRRTELINAHPVIWYGSYYGTGLFLAGLILYATWFGAG